MLKIIERFTKSLIKTPVSPLCELSHVTPGSTPAKIQRLRQTQPYANLHIRPPVTVFNRFVQFAIDERLSYPDALKLLMDRAGLD